MQMQLSYDTLLFHKSKNKYLIELICIQLLFHGVNLQRPLYFLSRNTRPLCEMRARSQ